MNERILVVAESVAVLDAVTRKRSVLIASNTHVAVDNVLEGLIEQTEDTADNFSLAPGTAIRIVSEQNRDSVSPRVTGHEHLTVAKAAAVLANQERRQAGLASCFHVERVLIN